MKTELKLIINPKSILIFSLYSFLFLKSVQAQEIQVNETFCPSSVIKQQMMQTDTDYYKKNAFFEQQYIVSALKSSNQLQPRASGMIYTIPVVVHIIHSGEAIGTQNNPSDATIQSMVQQASNRFRHTSNQKFANNPFSGIDCEIQFCFAQRTQNGSATNGIVRYNNPVQANPTSEDNLLNYLNEIKWDNSKYANLYVITTSPSDFSFCGVYYGGSQDDFTIYTSSCIWSGLIAHEMGHYFNLDHTFEGACTNNNCLTQGDHVCDTPPKATAAYKSPNSCSNPSNSCDTDDDDLSVNNPFRPIANGGIGDRMDALENYMDYTASCWAAFTQGQKTRMRLNIELLRKAMITNNFVCDGSFTCFPPTNLKVKINGSTSTLDWTENINTASWQIIYGESGFDPQSSGTIINVTTKPFNLPNLTANTSYDWYVHSVCSNSNSGYTPYSEVNTFATPSNITYCIADYTQKCEKRDDGEVYGIIPLTIQSFVLQNQNDDSYIIKNEKSDCLGATSNHTNIVGNVIAGQSYTFNVELGTSATGYRYLAHFGIWIDFNNDGDFEDANETLYLSTDYKGFFDGVIKIPNIVSNGNRRLRIRRSDEPLDMLNAACATIYSGEAEDYTLNIRGGIAPSISGINDSYCKNEPAINLAGKGSPAGGTFTVDGISATTLDPTSLPVGNHKIIYTINDIPSATLTIEIMANPSPSIAGLNTSYCKNTPSITLTGFPLGGSFTVDDINATVFDPTVLNISSHSVKYSVTQNGCSNSVIQQVAINALPDAQISANGITTFCQGNSVKLNATGGISYDWSNGIKTAENTISTLGEYMVTVTNSNGCKASATQKVTVNALPNAQILANGATTFCQGNSVNLTASGGTSYKWSNNTTASDLSVAQSGTYEVTVIDANNCSKTTSQVVTVNALPDAKITGSNTFCQGSSTTLTASGGNKYQWSSNANSATTEAIKASTEGVYSVTVTNENNCISTANITVKQSASLQVSIQGNKSFCAGSNTTLTASGGSTYLWSTGATTPSITVNKADIYSVTVSNIDGCSGSTSQIVSINPLPEAIINGSASLCTGSNAILTASGGLIYLWSTGEATPSVIISNAGNYAVTVTDAKGCKAIANKDVTIGSSLSPIITGKTAICAGETTTITASGGTNYAWSNGAKTPNITVSISGTYTVTVTDDTGCSGTNSQEVIVSPIPAALIEGSSTVCISSGSILTAFGGNKYKWSTDAITNAIKISQPGTYTVTVTNAGGCTAIATKTITATTTLTPTITGNKEFCIGDKTQLTATGGDSYLWSTGETSPNIIVSTPNTYTVTVSDKGGCSGITNQIVTLHPLPNALIEGKTDFCLGLNTTLTASGGISYNWSNGAATPSVTLNQAGNYTVTVTDANGCKATASKNIIINTKLNPFITGNPVICGNSGSTTLIASGGTNYLWSNGATTPTITVTTQGTYTVTVSNAEGCKGTADQAVILSALPTALITGDTVICNGGITTLKAIGGSKYQWSTSVAIDGISVDQPGIYTVTVTNAQGCSTVISKTVIASSDTIELIKMRGLKTFCEGQNTVLFMPDGYKYRWSTGDTSALIYVSNAGSYHVTVTNNKGCSSKISENIVMNSKPKAQFVVSNITKGVVSFTNTTIGADYYKWQFGDGITSLDKTPIHAYTANGNYTVTLIAVNNFGCSDTIKLPISLLTVSTVELLEGIKISLSPNPFSENIRIDIDADATVFKLKLDRITVQDVLGRLLLEEDIENYKNKIINTSSLAEGTYIISVWSKSKQFIVGKVVKMH